MVDLALLQPLHLPAPWTFGAHQIVRGLPLRRGAARAEFAAAPAWEKAGHQRRHISIQLFVDGAKTPGPERRKRTLAAPGPARSCDWPCRFWARIVTTLAPNLAARFANVLLSQ